MVDIVGSIRILVSVSALMDLIPGNIIMVGQPKIALLSVFFSFLLCCTVFLQKFPRLCRFTLLQEN